MNEEEYAGRKVIGIAPFAKHKGKIYPPEKMEAVIKELTSDNNNLILLFGGKGDEAAKLNEWENSFPNVINVAGKFTLSQELAIISKLDLLVCMDSANMHFASLVNTKCVSVWGATHPYMGFLGYGQSMKNCVGVDMPCRPCSVFGQKPCQRNDYACLGFIKTENIIEKINNNLK